MTISIGKKQRSCQEKNWLNLLILLNYFLIKPSESGKSGKRFPLGTRIGV